MTSTTTKQPAPASSYVPQDGLLLDVEDLFVEFHTHDGIAKAKARLDEAKAAVRRFEERQAQHGR